ncbi:hypothetical protein [Nostoc sp.]
MEKSGETHLIYRVDGDRSRISGGSGLGLAIARKGSIQVKSQPGLVVCQ